MSFVFSLIFQCGDFDLSFSNRLSDVTLNPGLFTMLDAYVLTGWFGTSGSRVIITSFTTEELDKGKEIVEKYGLKPTLGDVFAFEDAAKAYAKIDTGKGIKGKVVFEVAKI